MKTGIIIRYVILMGIASLGLGKLSLASAAGQYCHNFSEYPVKEIFKGPFKAPDVNESKFTKRFRTVIREGAEGPPDFAGHFSIAQWGCGTYCHVFAPVDRRTGRIIVSGVISEFGIEYQLDSRLLIIDGPGSLKEFFGDKPVPPEGQADDIPYTTYYFVYEEDKQSFQRLSNCSGNVDKKK